MQRALVVLALLAVPAAASFSASASVAARQWLRQFAGAPPSGDQLGELKSANPEAYAIVKALLAKRSLGLLDPKHPTARFTNSAPASEVPAEEQGPEAFAKFARPGELRASHRLASEAQEAASVTQVALPYADVQPASHHDWLNWKPQSSAMDDDAMVQNVLGAVAELKGKKAGLLSKHRNSNNNALAAEEESFGAGAQEAAAPVEPIAPAVAAQQPSAPAAPARENSYLKSIDFGMGAPAEQEPAPAAAKHENSYLKGIDLSGDMPTVVASPRDEKTSQVQSSSSNYLASFSWDDSKPQEQAKPKQPEMTMPSNGKDTNLLSWLGVLRKAPQPQAAAPAKPANPYLMDLS